MSAFLISAAIDLGRMLVILAILSALPFTHPRTRRTAVAVTWFAKRHAPRWLGIALVVCAFIPGPVDEILVVLAALYPVMRNSRSRHVFARVVRYAWSL